MAKTLDQFVQDQLGVLLLSNLKLAAENELLREESAALRKQAEASAQAPAPGGDKPH